MQIIEKPLTSANKQKNKERYVRIAFESLKEFDKKANRKVRFVTSQYGSQTEALCSMVKKGTYEQADAVLLQIIEAISRQIYTEEWENRQ